MLYNYRNVHHNRFCFVIRHRSQDCAEETETAEDVVMPTSPLETVVEEDVGVGEPVVDGDDAELNADRDSTVPVGRLTRKLTFITQSGLYVTTTFHHLH